MCIRDRWYALVNTNPRMSGEEDAKCHPIEDRETMIDLAAGGYPLIGPTGITRILARIAIRLNHGVDVHPMFRVRAQHSHDASPPNHPKMNALDIQERRAARNNRDIDRNHVRLSINTTPTTSQVTTRPIRLPRPHHDETIDSHRHRASLASSWAKRTTIDRRARGTPNMTMTMLISTMIRSSMRMTGTKRK